MGVGCSACCGRWRSGRCRDSPSPFTLGRDFSGVITQAGKGVTRLKEGDEVGQLILLKLQTYFPLPVKLFEPCNFFCLGLGLYPSLGEERTPLTVYCGTVYHGKYSLIWHSVTSLTTPFATLTIIWHKMFQNLQWWFRFLSVWSRQSFKNTAQQKVKMLSEA